MLAAPSRVQLSPVTDTPSKWRPPFQSLSPEQVQVWKAGTNLSKNEITYLRSLLADDELRRADRFRFDRDRNQYTIARGLLRMLTAAYVAVDSHEIVFRYSGNGKPELAFSPLSWQLRFNVAHSGEIVLLAFARNQRVGIDVEKIRADIECDQLAERYFSFYECSRLRKMSLENRRQGFFECWARKEAYIKAIGEGLSHPLQSFDVFSGSESLPHSVVGPESGVTWWIDNLDIAPDYAAAIAIEETAIPPEGILSRR